MEKKMNMRIWQPIITGISMIVSYCLFFSTSEYLLSPTLYIITILYGFFGGIAFLVWAIKTKSTASIILSILHIIPFSYVFFLFCVFALVGFAP